MKHAGIQTIVMCEQVACIAAVGGQGPRLACKAMRGPGRWPLPRIQEQEFHCRERCRPSMCMQERHRRQCCHKREVKICDSQNSEEEARYAAEFKRKGCREGSRGACAGGSNGSVGWTALPRAGGAATGQHEKAAADHADIGSRLSEEVLFGHGDDLRPAGSNAMLGYKSGMRSNVQLRDQAANVKHDTE